MSEGFNQLTLDKLTKADGISEINRMFQILFDNTVGNTENVKPFSGYGSPEGVISASVGSIYLRLDGGVGATLYVKESGRFDTGWRVVGTSGSSGLLPGGSDTEVQFNNAGVLDGFGSWDGSIFNVGGALRATAIYFGSPSTEGTWRIRVSGDNLAQERLESGVWVEKVAATP